MSLRELEQFAQWFLTGKLFLYLFFSKTHQNGFHFQVPRIEFFQIFHVKVQGLESLWSIFSLSEKQKQNQFLGYRSPVLRISKPCAQSPRLAPFAPSASHLSHCFQSSERGGVVTDAGEGGWCHMGETFGGKSTPVLHIHRNSTFFFSFCSCKAFGDSQPIFKLSNVD